MFHIYSIDGVRLNIPFESLKAGEEVNSLEKSYRVRKIIDKKESQYKERESEKLSTSTAVKAYKDALKVTNEEQILHAYEIMKSPVLTLKPETNIADAIVEFRTNDISHMPVLSSERKIIGIVSDRDLLNYISFASKDNTGTKTVSDIMIREVITSSGITDIRRIARVMFDRHIGTMLIVDDSGKLEGIITRSDILYALINYQPISIMA